MYVILIKSTIRETCEVKVVDIWEIHFFEKCHLCLSKSFLIKSNSLGFMWPWCTVSMCFLHLLWGWPHWGSVEVMIFYSMPRNHIVLNTLENWIYNLFLYIYHLQNGKHRRPTAPSMAPSWVSAQSRTWRMNGTWFVTYIITWPNHGNWRNS